MLLSCSCHPTHASTVLYSSWVWQHGERKKGFCVLWEMSIRCSCPASPPDRNGQGGLYTSSASSGLGSSQELLCRFALNAPSYIKHRAPLCGQELRNSITLSPGEESSSLLKRRLLKSTWEEEGNLSMTLFPYKNVAGNVTPETLLGCFA